MALPDVTQGLLHGSCQPQALGWRKITEGIQHDVSA
jgi:hypothetical protein